MEIPYIVEPRPDSGLTNGKLGIWLAGSWNFTGLREAKVDFAVAPVYLKNVSRIQGRLSSLCCLSMLKFMPESVPSRRVFQVGMQ